MTERLAILGAMKTMLEAAFPAGLKVSLERGQAVTETNCPVAVLDFKSDPAQPITRGGDTVGLDRRLQTVLSLYGVGQSGLSALEVLDPLVEIADRTLAESTLGGLALVTRSSDCTTRFEQIDVPIRVQELYYEVRYRTVTTNPVQVA